MRALTAKRCAAICATVLTLGACQAAQNGGEALTGAPRAQKTASQPQPETPRSAGSVPAYSRDAFGSGWTDPDHNGCDARQDAIRAATTNRVMAGPCKITRADIYDRYAGRTYPGANPSAFDIDHVVALHDAWNSGAASWSLAKRKAFANDPADVVLTTASANRSKGDQDPSEWAPLPCAPASATCEPRSLQNGACWYVTHYRAIKLRWHLHTTAPQRSAVRRTLATCTGTENR
jgi:hypothetical protein